MREDAEARVKALEGCWQSAEAQLRETEAERDGWKESAEENIALLMKTADERDRLREENARFKLRQSQKNDGWVELVAERDRLRARCEMYDKANVDLQDELDRLREALKRIATMNVDGPRNGWMAVEMEKVARQALEGSD